MKVLVTGASGFIGSHTVAALSAAGHEVVAFVRSASKLRSVLAPFELDVSPAVALGDLADAASIAAAAHDSDAIVHTAAAVAVAGQTGPEGDLNVAGTRAVLDAATARGIDRVVYLSTLAAFLPSEDPVLDEHSRLAEPMSSYGRSKRDAELLVRAAQDEGLGVVTFYPGGVYGPLSPNLDNSFAAILGATSFGMMCPPGGMGVIDVRDLAAMIVVSLERCDGPRRFMCGGHYLTWRDWTLVLREASGLDVAIYEVSAEDMVEMGRDFDRQRATLHIDTPLSEEAAVIMAAGRPTDDTAALVELGVTYRPVLDTMSDAVEYLRRTGALSRLPT
ncbi:MAG: NAD-dependent epimerase/dehydratase family protein [Actinobacteria bacterium]|nr:NAD-dependent epimerase/dehydratase family protein [Actinomycetota bacterium]